MRIIFLDIDGVLNSDCWDKSEEAKSKEYPENYFEPRAIRLLNKIIESTEAKIVLSSTWRLKHDIQYMNDLFQKLGVNSEIIDYTPDLKKDNNYVVRGNEILKWCKDNEELIGDRYINYQNYVIIDDGTDMLYWQRKQLFTTDRFSGLTPTITNNIIRQFNSLN